MSEEHIECAREECGILFQRKTHNQKYCTDECCRLATNQRIMQKYYAKRDQRLGKTRYCEECGITKLSRYNDSQICSSCKRSKESAANETVANMLESVFWVA